MFVTILCYLLLAVLLAVIAACATFYLYFLSSYNYWRDKGIPHLKPSFPFGNLGDVIRGKKSLIDQTIENYRKFEGERFFGMFSLNKPVLVLRDPTIIEKVLVTDFTNFCSKLTGPNKDDHLSFYLGNLQGEEWRQLRQKLNSAFSQMKLKQMTEHISKCGDFLVKTIENNRARGEKVNASCLGYIYSQRVIAGCAFGIEHDCVGMKTFIANVKKRIFNAKVVHLIFLCQTFAPKYIKLLYAVPQVATVVEYFKNLTLATIQVRKEFKTKRNDILQILIDLREEEELHGEYGRDQYSGIKNGDTTQANKRQVQKSTVHLNPCKYSILDLYLLKHTYIKN